ncbi:MAG TPA: alpha-2-macroglobulin [Pseudomonadales bacterium]|nr:alpha-2-macroglobulin [Pseudomonadales bacterium]
MLKILLLPFKMIFSILFSLLLFLWQCGAWWAEVLFGKIDWHAPAWAVSLHGYLSQIKGWAANNPRRAAGTVSGILLTGASSVYGWYWYKHLPQPHTVHYSISAPSLTDYSGNAPQVDVLEIRFSESVAPLDQIEKPVTRGIDIAPQKAGKWTWVNDRVLRFKPDSDWPVDGYYDVTLAKKGWLTPGTLLENYSDHFKTAAFSAKISESSFYQDPTDSTLKKLVATVHFSHPVDEDSLRSRITLIPGEGLQFRDARDTRQAAFTLTFDKQKLNAYIHSLPLAMPLETVPLTLHIDKNVASNLGGNKTAEALETSISVTGRYRLTFDNIQSGFANNEKDEPQQILTVDSSHPVADEKIRDKVKAWLLPVDNGHGGEYWSETDVTETVLKNAQPLVLAHVPSMEPLNQHHAFRFKAPVNRSVYVRVAENIESTAGYIAKKPTASVFSLQEYPKALHMLSSGALLNLNGEKKIGFMSRGVKRARVEIARILPEQLHHLVGQNQGSFAHPSMSEDDFDRLVERDKQTIELSQSADNGNTIYDHVDLGKYLNAEGGRKGIFVLHLTNDEANVNRTFEHNRYYYSYSENSDDEGNENYGNHDSEHTDDLRFVLVTDLGIITKRSLDQSQDVFVQSLSTGKPVDGANVRVIGKNGLDVQAGVTDSNGHVSFPKMGEFTREKTPLMYLVSKGNDLSFLPINDRNRSLGFSRFDIGGLSNATAKNQLSAYLFTDRGLYRPGETAHVQLLVRTADWLGQLKGLPLELDITDPRGAMTQHNNIALSDSGFDAVDFTSSEVAPAGEYQANLYLIESNHYRTHLGSTRFTVRDFEPDRMKVDASLSELPVQGWIKPQDVKGLVRARHLFGAPASGRTVKAEFSLDPVFPAFPRYPDHHFYIGDVVKNSVQEHLQPTTTDDKGEATLDFDLKRFAKSTYQLNLLAQVFEAEGGRNVQAEKSMLVSSAPFLLGIKSEDTLTYVSKNAVRKVNVLAINPSLEPVAADGLSLNFYEYRYVSVLVKQRNGTFKFESRRKDILLDNKPFTVAKGGQDLPLPTNEPGDFAYLIKDADGNTLNEVRFSVAGQGNVTRSLERNAELQLKLSKKSYGPGETIEINVRAPYTGSGLITIEKDKIYAYQWFRADTTNSVQTITVPDTVEGNAYVNVQFVRDPSSPEVYMSPLSYGVVPFSISLDARRLDVKVDAPATVLPGDNIAFRLTASEPSRIALFAIDEGILQVAAYKNPDPLAFFFQKRALEVSTSQILDLILPEFTQLMNAAAGGDGEGALQRQLNPFKRKHQAPAVYWSGLVDVPAGTQTFNYPVPESFNGKLRIIAVAATPARIGVYTGATEVRGPLVLTPNIPAFIAPNDEVLVTSGIYNNLAEKRTVTLSLKTSEGLTVASDAKVTVDIEPQHEAVAEFRLKGTDKLGSADMYFTAETRTAANPVTATADIAVMHLHETTSVRPAVPYRTQLSVGRTDKSSLDIGVTRDLHEQLRKAEFGVDLSPMVWMRGLSNYLENYAYACTEQLVSRALPDLVFEQPADLKAAHSPAINNAISILRQRQNEQGGFGLWAANPIVIPVVTAYATDFLLEARERGYPVPQDMLDRASGFLEVMANQPNDDMEEMRARAYAAYLLTRQGKTTTRILASITDQLNTYHSKEWKTDITAAYLASSHMLLKQDDVARALVKGVPWRGINNEAGLYGTYYDSLVHDTELLTLLARHFPDMLDKVPATVLDSFGDRISHNNYHSLSAANMIRAIDLYGTKVAANGGKVDAKALLKDKQTLLLAMEGKPPRASMPSGTQSVTVTKTDGPFAFYLMSESGFDHAVPQDAMTQGLEVVSEYQDLNGKPLVQTRIGDEFLVQLRIRSTDRNSISQIALVDLLPGGVEPVVQPPVSDPVASAGGGNESTSDSGESGNNNSEAADGSEPVASNAGSNRISQAATASVAGRSTWQPEYADIRDDRIVLYGTASHDAQTYVVRVRAINAGKFQGPPPYAEAMYEPTVQGRGKPAALEITKP